MIPFTSTDTGPAQGARTEFPKIPREAVRPRHLRRDCGGLLYGPGEPAARGEAAFANRGGSGRLGSKAGPPGERYADPPISPEVDMRVC